MVQSGTYIKIGKEKPETFSRHFQKKKIKKIKKMQGKVCSYTLRGPETLKSRKKSPLAEGYLNASPRHLGLLLALMLLL